MNLGRDKICLEQCTTFQRKILFKGKLVQDKIFVFFNQEFIFVFLFFWFSFWFFFPLPYQASLIMTPNLLSNCQWYKYFSSLLTWYISLHSVFSSLSLTVDWLPFLWAWGNVLGAVFRHLALHMLGQAFIELPGYIDFHSTIMTYLNCIHGLTASLEISV